MYTEISMVKKGLLFVLMAIVGLIVLSLISKTLLDGTTIVSHKKLITIRLPRGSKIFKVPMKGEDNIFFIESSCAIGGPNKTAISMKPRQACAVESAAYLNPKKRIYYIDTCLDPKNFNAVFFSKEEFVRQVFNYPNVYVFHVELYNYLKDSPLQEWIKLGLLNHSQYPVAHASDVLRLVTLWKYGGLYLDLDMVVVRPLDRLGWNFVVAESDVLLGNSVLSFSAEGTGHHVVELYLREMERSFDGSNWDINGPKLISRVMYRLCDYIPVKNMSGIQCSGINVKKAATFFPFPYQLWHLLFTEEVDDFVMSIILQDDTYSMHAWNKMSHHKEIKVGSRQPYAQLAQRFCRKVCFTVGNSL